MAASLGRVFSHVCTKTNAIFTTYPRLLSTTCCRLEDKESKNPIIAELFSREDDKVDGHGSSGLEKAFRMFEKVEDSAKEPDHLNEESFAAMLRKSKLMQIGNPNGRIVIGTVFEVAEDDLYIDFGGKFHCVCKKPRARVQEYKRGAQVRIRLHDLELSSRFLGAVRDLTLLEADATLIGLYKPKDGIVE